MNNYILLEKNSLETTEQELVFDLPEEFRNQYTLRDLMLTNITMSNSVTDKFFQPLYAISKCIRETSLKLIRAKELNSEMLKALDLVSRKFFYLSCIDFLKPYKLKSDAEMGILNDKIIKQFTTIVKTDQNIHSIFTSKSACKTINLLRDTERNAVDVLSDGRLRVLIDRTYSSRGKLKTANNSFIAVPVWNELSETYSLPNRKLLSGIRGLLYFAKALKVPNVKKKSFLFTTGNYFLDALDIAQTTIDTFIKILETDCFKLSQVTDENLKEVYDLLASLDLKYSFILSKMKKLYHFKTEDNLKILEKNLFMNTVLTSGSDIAKCILEEFDYQLNSLEQDFAICRFMAYNFNSVLELALKKYIDDKAYRNNIDNVMRIKAKQHVILNCLILTSALVDIPATPILSSFLDHRFPNLTIEDIVSEHYPEFLNNPDFSNLILNNFIFNIPDVAKFKIVKKQDEEDDSKVYIYLYAFPNKVKAPSL